MAIETRAYAAMSPRAELIPFTIQRREPGPQDVLIEIQFCGVCHSDFHHSHAEGHRGRFPMVPGHEIVGKVDAVGSGVTRWRRGDTVGVGCIVDSCRSCEPCLGGEEQYCAKGFSPTYNGYERDLKTRTYGGYSTTITVDESFVVRIPTGLSHAQAAPLLCAGITTYAPLERAGVQDGMSVAVLGLGGLGHLAVKFARAMGAQVIVLSHSAGKRDAAMQLGADGFVDTNDARALKPHLRRFDYILDTISSAHDCNKYIELLALDGTLILLGLTAPTTIDTFALLAQRRCVAGSAMGGIAAMQRMLDFCVQQHVVADIELIAMHEINGAFKRMLASDVRYRFVIELDSLRR
jgi:uncharacterized zinc-type alcohol dehydrogenase-like protein